MAEKMNKPTIRLKEFTDAWKLRKVSELLIERNVQAPKSDEYPLMAFIANQGIAPKGERYDRSSLVNDTENKLYKKTEYGDFIYSSNNLETGSIGLNNYGKASISPVYSIFQTTELADHNFIGRRFVRKDFISEMVKWRQGVIYGQWRIHESDFTKIEVIVPTVAEQKKIGAFLRQLDNIIDIHQRKYDKLLNIKKSMLEKMFPKACADVPEIRFKGFTGAWERRDFLDIFTFMQNNALSRADLNYKYGAAQNIHYGDVLIKFGAVLDIEKESIPFTNDEKIASKFKTSYLRNGDVIIADAAEDETVGKCTEITGISTQIVISGLHTIPCRPRIEFAPSFLGYYMNSNSYHFQLVPLMQGTKVTSISKSTLQNTVLRYPSNPKEQAMIGISLSKLDKLISLQLQELEKLKNIKKALLERMFV